MGLPTSPGPVALPGVVFPVVTKVARLTHPAKVVFVDVFGDVVQMRARPIWSCNRFPDVADRGSPHSARTCRYGLDRIPRDTRNDLPRVRIESAD